MIKKKPLSEALKSAYSSIPTVTASNDGLMSKDGFIYRGWIEMPEGGEGANDLLNMNLSYGWYDVRGLQSFGGIKDHGMLVSLVTVCLFVPKNSKGQLYIAAKDMTGWGNGFYGI